MSMQNIEHKLDRASRVLRKYGFDFWANKLDSTKSDVNKKADVDVIEGLKKLYGGFGTLMDLAVDPYELPDGVTEIEGNKELLGSLNELHRAIRTL